MPILSKGTTYATGQQVTATNLNNLVDNATFTSGAVDNVTTQLSGGAIIVKDGGISGAKITSGTTATMNINGTVGATTPAAGSFTTIAASGDLTASGTSIINVAGTNNIPLRVEGQTTGYSAIRVQNTTGQCLVGVESSAGGAVVLGASGYDAFIRGASGIAFSGDNGTGMQLRLSSGGAAITGACTMSSTLAVTGAATLSSTLAVSGNSTIGGTLGVTGAVSLTVPLGLASGGLGVSLSDPGADRILFWDESDNQMKFLTLGTNLSITGTTINAASGGGGTIGGSTGGTDNRIIRADGTGGSTIQASGITIDDSDNITGAATVDVGTGGYKVSGTKVVGAQQAAITDIALTTNVLGSDTVDALTIEGLFAGTETKINLILAALRTHGLIAT